MAVLLKVGSDGRARIMDDAAGQDGRDAQSDYSEPSGGTAEEAGTKADATGLSEPRKPRRPKRADKNGPGVKAYMLVEPLPRPGTPLESLPILNSRSDEQLARDVYQQISSLEKKDRHSFEAYLVLHRDDHVNVDTALQRVLAAAKDAGSKEVGLRVIVHGVHIGH